MTVFKFGMTFLGRAHRFRIKFGMTVFKFGMTVFKFGMTVFDSFGCFSKKKHGRDWRGA